MNRVFFALFVFLFVSNLEASESCVVNQKATCINFSESYSTEKALNYCSVFPGGDFREKPCPTGGSVESCLLSSSGKLIEILYYSEGWSQKEAKSNCEKMKNSMGSM